MKISKPNRIKHEYSQILLASPEVVFPLLCPVEEEKWVPGWNPDFVKSFSGVAEHNCVFQTTEKSLSSVWIRDIGFEPERLYLEMYKVTPGHTVGQLCIQLFAHNQKQTKADISYEYTSLSETGDEFLKNFTSDYYIKFMQNWGERHKPLLENRREKIG